MDARTRRLGLNEAFYRQVNERLREVQDQLGDGDALEFVCECGHAGCKERLTVPLECYRQVRADGALFLLVPGHEEPDIEQVVDRVDEAVVVRKLPDGPGRLAVETQPS